MIGLDTINCCILRIALSKLRVDLQEFLKEATQYHRPRVVFIFPHVPSDSR